LGRPRRDTRGRPPSCRSSIMPLEASALGEAHYGVEACLDHIDGPIAEIAEIEIQYYLGIGPHERRRE
jgi:hypothetical protein